MQDILEEIWKQVREVRNLCTPFELKLAALEEHIGQMRLLLGAQIGSVESLLLANTLKLEQQGLEIATLLERLDWIEPALKSLLKAMRPESLPMPMPVHDEKVSVPTPS